MSIRQQWNDRKVNRLMPEVYSGIILCQKEENYD